MKQVPTILEQCPEYNRMDMMASGKHRVLFRPFNSTAAAIVARFRLGFPLPLVFEQALLIMENRTGAFFFNSFLTSFNE